MIACVFVLLLEHLTPGHHLPCLLPFSDSYGAAPALTSSHFSLLQVDV